MDTATRRIGLALYDGVDVRHEVNWASTNRHTVALSQAVQDALSQLELTIDVLEAVAVATGPGSYTGLRIGVAVAKGLALARHIPLIGIPTLDIIAAAQPLDAERKLAAILEAGRGRYAVAWYQAGGERWAIEAAAQLLTAEELNEAVKAPTILAGDLTEEVRTALSRKRVNAQLASPASSLRRAAFLAELAWARYQAGDVDDPISLAPTYLQTGQNIPQ
jgi:tRNA threonylcarbamoyladenosine biosynthesis protein TsaB